MKAISTIFIVIFILLTACAFSYCGTSSITSNDTNYVELYNKYAKAGRDESLNAAPYYKKAFDLIADLPADFNSFDLQVWPSDLTEKKLKAVKQWLNANNASLEQFKIGSQREAYWVELKGRLSESQFSDLSKFRISCLALMFRAKLDAINGDFSGGFSDIFSAYQAGNQLSNKNFLIYQLVGIALRSTAADATFAILQKYPLNTSYLKELQEKFVSLSAKTEKFDFYPERLFIYDYMNSLFTDDGKGDGYLTEKTINEKIFLINKTEQNIQQCKTLKRNSTIKITEKQLDYFEQIKDKTPYQLKILDANKVLYEMAGNNVLAQNVRPTLMVMGLYFGGKNKTEALISTLAILRYKTDKKELPDSLEKLVSAGYLDKIPLDVCSDNPLIYKRSGDNFVLYSLGGDFDDDNAKIRVKTIMQIDGDIVFWPFEK
jgi:hypothetical protein